MNTGWPAKTNALCAHWDRYTVCTPRPMHRVHAFETYAPYAHQARYTVCSAQTKQEFEIAFSK